MPVKKNSRLGKIDFLRFLFCMFILFYHINKDFGNKKWMIAEGLSFFKRGFVGVEFFFLLTGYFTAREIYKKLDSDTDIGKDSLIFLWKKVKPILPYHIILVIAMIITKVFLLKLNIFSVITEGLPSIFFLHMAGFPGKAILYVEWYLSAMFISLAFLYPVARKHYRIYVRVLAPFVGFLILGLKVNKHGSLGLVTKFLYFSPSGVWRAFAVISIGMFIFELLRLMKQVWQPSNRQRVLLTVVEVILYCVLIYTMMVTGFERKLFMGFVVIIMSIAVAISLSGYSLGDRLFNNKFVYFLGGITLPVYLCQNVVRAYFVKFGHHLRGSVLIITDLSAILLTGTILYFVIEGYHKYKVGKREKRV